MKQRVPYQFHIWSVWDRSNWLMVQDDKHEIGDYEDPFLYFLLCLKRLFKDVPIVVGDGRYQFEKDPNHFIYQWDDLFGMAVEYHCRLETAQKRLQALIDRVNQMSPDAYLPPVDGQDGNNRFRTGDSSAAVSSNAPERPEAADIINQEMAEKEQRRKVTPDC